MSASRSTATKTAKKSESVSSATDFKKKKEGKVLTLPSGLKMRCRRVNLASFLQNDDDVPNPLLPIIQESLAKGQEADLEKIVGSPEQGVDIELVTDMLAMVDNMVVSIALEPKVYPVPEDGEEDEDLVYTSDIDEEDKMFLFQWAIGGTEDIAAFRKEAEEGMASLAQIQSGGGKTK